MIKAFVDTNILIDLIADRRPFSRFAIDIFQKAEKEQLELFASSHSVATTHYVLKKYLEEKELRLVISEMLELLTVIPVDQSVLKKALKSTLKDFEDAVQLMAAQSVHSISHLVTRNIKDYKGAPIEVLAPDVFCSLI